MSTDVKPFSIAIPDADLDDLRERLARTRWPDAETTAAAEGPNWDQGTPLAYVQELAEYWRTRYDWRRAESLLNGFPQFTTALDGPGGTLDIHFLHLRSKHADALPLLLTHGWPGSVIEFHKVLGPLTDPEAHGGDAADAFHVVCPTLPGFGFSGKPTVPGWGVPAIAKAWHQLMGRLGYDRYVAQGGDWGAIVASQMGVDAPEGLAGIHVNMPIVTPDPETMDDLTPAEQSALAALQYYQSQDTGYSKQQATRPQTLGYGLADSPVGQLAWIVEKFHRWMDCDDSPENVLTKDELLDNVMLYWLTDSGASSARIYWESVATVTRDPVHVPTGMTIFPKEFLRTSRRWAEKRFSKLIHFTEYDRGGHFAALERPETLVAEIRSCFGQLRG
jgi:pimeloyl-ACP methyl ester carboxylesterase